MVVGHLHAVSGEGLPQALSQGEVDVPVIFRRGPAVDGVFDGTVAVIGEVHAGGRVLEDPAPSVYLTNYGDSSIEYTVYCWATPENYWDVHFALGERLRETFAAHGVEMTYDHLNVHIVENRS